MDKPLENERAAKELAEPATDAAAKWLLADQVELFKELDRILLSAQVAPIKSVRTQQLAAGRKIVNKLIDYAEAQLTRMQADCKA